jgi:tight adherence protein C
MDLSSLPLTLMFGLGILGIFASLGIILTIIGVSTQEKRAVGRSLAALEAMSSAPVEMRQELEVPFSERVVEPLIAKFSKVSKRFSPSGQAERIQYRLDVAGNPAGWTVERVQALKLVGFTALLMVSLAITIVIGTGLIKTLIICVGLSMVGYVIPNFIIYQRGYDRSERMQKELPDALDLLTISVEAGLAFDAALSRVAKSTEGPLAQEFARVLQEMNIGVGRVEAIRALGERTTIPELKAFVTAMVQADAFGIPIAQVLRVQSSEMRVKRRQRAEEMAQKVPVKILFPLIFCILPTLFLVIMGPAVIKMIESFSGKLG